MTGTKLVYVPVADKIKLRTLTFPVDGLKVVVPKSSVSKLEAFPNVWANAPVPVNCKLGMLVEVAPAVLPNEYILATSAAALN